MVNFIKPEFLFYLNIREIENVVQFFYRKFLRTFGALVFLGQRSWMRVWKGSMA